MPERPPLHFCSREKARRFAQEYRQEVYVGNTRHELVKEREAELHSREKAYAWPSRSRVDPMQELWTARVEFYEYSAETGRPQFRRLELTRDHRPPTDCDHQPGRWCDCDTCFNRRNEK